VYTLYVILVVRVHITCIGCADIHTVQYVGLNGLDSCLSVHGHYNFVTVHPLRVLTSNMLGNGYNSPYRLKDAYHCSNSMRKA